MTAPERETPAEWVARTRAEQGLPPTIEDEAVLRQVATVLSDSDAMPGDPAQEAS